MPMSFNEKASLAQYWMPTLQARNPYAEAARSAIGGIPMPVQYNPYAQAAASSIYGTPAPARYNPYAEAARSAIFAPDFMDGQASGSSIAGSLGSGALSLLELLNRPTEAVQGAISGLMGGQEGVPGSGGLPYHVLDALGGAWRGFSGQHDFSPQEMIERLPFVGKPLSWLPKADLPLFGETNIALAPMSMGLEVATDPLLAISLLGIASGVGSVPGSAYLAAKATKKAATSAGKISAQLSTKAGAKALAEDVIVKGGVQKKFKNALADFDAAWEQAFRHHAKNPEDIVAKRTFQEIDSVKALLLKKDFDGARNLIAHSDVFPTLGWGPASIWKKYTRDVQLGLRKKFQFLPSQALRNGWEVTKLPIKLGTATARSLWGVLKWNKGGKESLDAIKKEIDNLQDKIYFDDEVATAGSKSIPNGMGAFYRAKDVVEERKFRVQQIKQLSGFYKILPAGDINAVRASINDSYKQLSDIVEAEAKGPNSNAIQVWGKDALDQLKMYQELSDGELLGMIGRKSPAGRHLANLLPGLDDTLGGMVEWIVSETNMLPLVKAEFFKAATKTNKAKEEMFDSLAKTIDSPDDFTKARVAARDYVLAMEEGKALPPFMGLDLETGKATAYALYAMGDDPKHVMAVMSSLAEGGRDTKRLIDIYNKISRMKWDDNSFTNKVAKIIGVAIEGLDAEEIAKTGVVGTLRRKLGENALDDVYSAIRSASGNLTSSEMQKLMTNHQFWQDVNMNIRNHMIRSGNAEIVDITRTMAKDNVVYFKPKTSSEGTVGELEGEFARFLFRKTKDDAQTLADLQGLFGGDATGGDIGYFINEVLGATLYQPVQKAARVNWSTNFFWDEKAGKYILKPDDISAFIDKNLERPFELNAFNKYLDSEDAKALSEHLRGETAEQRAYGKRIREVVRAARDKISSIPQARLEMLKKPNNEIYQFVQGKHLGDKLKGKSREEVLKAKDAAKAEMQQVLNDRRVLEEARNIVGDFNRNRYQTLVEFVLQNSNDPKNVKKLKLPLFPAWSETSIKRRLREVFQFARDPSAVRPSKHIYSHYDEAVRRGLIPRDMPIGRIERLPQILIRGSKDGKEAVLYKARNLTNDSRQSIIEEVWGRPLRTQSDLPEFLKQEAKYVEKKRAMLSRDFEAPPDTDKVKVLRAERDKITDRLKKFGAKHGRGGSKKLSPRVIATYDKLVDMEMALTKQIEELVPEEKLIPGSEARQVDVEPRIARTPEERELFERPRLYNAPPYERPEIQLGKARAAIRENPADIRARERKIATSEREISPEAIERERAFNEMEDIRNELNNLEMEIWRAEASPEATSGFRDKLLRKRDELMTDLQELDFVVASGLPEGAQSYILTGHKNIAELVKKGEWRLSQLPAARYDFHLNNGKPFANDAEIAAYVKKNKLGTKAEAHGDIDKALDNLSKPELSKVPVLVSDEAKSAYWSTKHGIIVIPNTRKMHEMYWQFKRSKSGVRAVDKAAREFEKAIDKIPAKAAYFQAIMDRERFAMWEAITPFVKNFKDFRAFVLEHEYAHLKSGMGIGTKELKAAIQSNDYSKALGLWKEYFYREQLTNLFALKRIGKVTSNQKLDAVEAEFMRELMGIHSRQTGETFLDFRVRNVDDLAKRGLLNVYDDMFAKAIAASDPSNIGAVARRIREVEGKLSVKDMEKDILSPAAKSQPKVHAMKYGMEANQNIWGRKTSTIAELEAGNRTSTTRTYALGKTGEIVQLSDEAGKVRPQLYRITGTQTITPEMRRSSEFWNKLSKTEGWTKNEMTSGKVASSFRTGNVTTYLEKVEGEKIGFVDSLGKGGKQAEKDIAAQWTAATEEYLRLAEKNPNVNKALLALNKSVLKIANMPWRYMTHFEWVRRGDIDPITYFVRDQKRVISDVAIKTIQSGDAIFSKNSERLEPIIFKAFKDFDGDEAAVLAMGHLQSLPPSEWKSVSGDYIKKFGKEKYVKILKSIKLQRAEYSRMLEEMQNHLEERMKWMARPENKEYLDAAYEGGQAAVLEKMHKQYDGFISIRSLKKNPDYNYIPWNRASEEATEEFGSDLFPRNSALMERKSKEAPTEINANEEFNRYVHKYLRMTGFGMPELEMRKHAFELGNKGQILRARYHNNIADMLGGRRRFIDDFFAALVEPLVKNPKTPKWIRDRLQWAPATQISQMMTQTAYRGVMWGNPGLAIRNTTQVANLVAAGGPTHLKRAMVNYFKDTEFTKTMKNEYYEAHAYRQVAGLHGVQAMNTWKLADEVGYGMFNFTENMLRGIGFFAGISKELADNPGIYKKFLKKGNDINSINFLRDLYKEARLGKNKDAIDAWELLTGAGKQMDELTMWDYGVSGRSPFFRHPITQLIGQFLNYPIKALEFILNDVLGIDKIIRNMKKSYGINTFEPAAMKRQMWADEGTLAGRAKNFIGIAATGGGMVVMADLAGFSIQNPALEALPMGPDEIRRMPFNAPWSRVIGDAITGNFHAMSADLLHATVPGGVMAGKVMDFADKALERPLTVNDYILLANMYPSKQKGAVHLLTGG